MSLDFATYRDRLNAMYRSDWRRRLRAMLDLCTTYEEIWQVGNDALQQVGYRRRYVEDRGAHARRAERMDIYVEIEAYKRKIFNWSEHLDAYRDVTLEVCWIVGASVDPTGFLFYPSNYGEEWDYFDLINRPERLERPDDAEAVE